MSPPRVPPDRFGGGKNVLGEVGSIAELTDLLDRHTPPDLADLRETG
ncbi:hypothetical protein [Micromonospora sp. HUAS LYJ1]|nr:hypothetical protein [Micromonospora sp. HUAS LYJ1]WKU04861.1 hypothetical protein Q2K16_29485 [Micromonospora sp. HUAS LYJ1]